MGKYILIANDNEGILEILSTYVTKEDFFPIIAHDGEAALTKFVEFRPLLLLLNVMMPKKDGYTVFWDIRQSSNVPIIMLTAKGEDFEVKHV